LFENASSEICARENGGLLAYSPMGFGVFVGQVFVEVESSKARLSFVSSILEIQ
jgi:aryl-alcohol dehydrogenase-like predicted oxidoreductase